MADIKRMRYFDQQLLVLDDFTDEQAYHIGMRQRHNQLLHTPGIAKGLEVNRTGVKEIKVKQGMAINEQGQEIVLDEESNAIKLDEFVSGDKILITIRYKPVEDAPTGDPPQNRRILEKAELKKIKEGTGVPIDKSEVQLARITMGANDIVEPFDMTVRRVAGASAFANPEADFVVRSIAFSSTALPNTQWPRLSAGAANQVNVSSDLNARNLNLTGALNVTGPLSALASASVTGNLRVEANLSIGGNLGVGTTSPQDKLHVTGGNLRLDNSRGLFIEDASRVPKRVLLADTSNTLRIGSGGGLGFNRIDFDLGSTNTVMTLIGGNVGIGTPSPGAKLEINDGDLLLKAKSEDSGDIIFQSSGGGEKGRIWSNPTAGAGLFFSSGDLNPDITIASGGNVGIGTPAPENSEGWGRVLDLLGTGTAKFSVRTNAIDARVLAHEIGWWGAPAGMIVGTKGNHPLSLATNAASRLTILGDGRIGIGTSAPDRILTIDQPGPTTGVFANIKNDNHEILLGVDQAAVVSAMTASDLQFRTNNANRMVIKATSGNIGIGISDSPAQRLDVFGRIRLRENPATGSAGLWLFQNTPAVERAFIGMASDDHVGFWGNVMGKWGLVMNVANGNVSIGPTIGTAAFPPRRLYVEGTEIHSGGTDGGFSFANRNTASYVDIPSNGERWVLYALDGVARLWSGVDKVHFRTTGVVVASSYQQFSDENLKTGIEPLGGVLERLKKIRAASFEWNELATKLGPERGRREIGLIAQDLEATFPEVVSSIGNENYKTIDYGRMSAVLVEAVKELLAKNEALALRIENLEGSVGQHAFQ
jgi:Chaperone of endosialidase